MIPTYTYAIKQELLDTFLGNNLIVALINAPTLGITDTPSAQQLENRATYTMTNVFSSEIGLANLNGYARQIILPGDITVNQVNTQLSDVDLSVSFTATGGDFDPFTHLVVIKDADLVNADPILNGNNRGSTIGTIIFIEPVDNGGAPLTLIEGLSYNYDFKLQVSSEVV